MSTLMGQAATDNTNTQPATNETTNQPIADANTNTQTAQTTEGQANQDAPKEIVYTDFKLPEGYEIKPDILGKFTGVAKELKLDQDNAQKLVDIAAEHARMIIDAQAEALMRERENWVESIKTDKDFGGAKFNETIERAQRALKTFGSNELLSLLDSSGLGDNPEVIKLLAKIDKAVGEDRTVDGVSGNNRTGLTAAQLIYGK